MDRGAHLRPEAETALQEAQAEPGSAFLSPITAWEIGMLVAKGRIVLSAPPLRWFESALEAGIGLADLPPSVLVESTQLEDARLRDPADRILAATARAYGYRLVTRDRPLLDYAAAGHISAIAC